jgi:glutamate synthase domain-containing protein 1
MCGIVGLFWKNPQREAELGRHFAGMLACMSSRGPDSAGFAVYGEPAPDRSMKATLYHSAKGYDWGTLISRVEKLSGAPAPTRVLTTHALMTVALGEGELRALLREEFPGVALVSFGRSVRIMKEIGRPEDVISRFGVSGMKGSHAIGHTRMATESAVTTAGSHPFSTGQDLCLVHNGSLSNHNRLRQNLRREGIEFQTDNDSEVAAGYLTWRLNQGASLQQALEAALVDLDGFYTFTIGTGNGFAVLRDPIACKPAVLAETDDYVAMSSEYRSLAALPGIAKARLWEPEPATVYTWEHN